MHFSQRTEFGADTDPLMRSVEQRRRAGLPLLDLTESNPTRCGLDLPAKLVLPPLAAEENVRYRAEPFGPTTAREAIASAYYAPRGIAIHPEELMLTASTSEAYSFLFRLLCEPGDQVLVPQPSYPLFDLLARLGDVETRNYPLRFHEWWEIDFEALEAAITPRTRAIVVVHPNNPTGHFASAREQEQLDRLAAKHGLPLLVDEVFLDYAIEARRGEPDPVSFAARSEPSALTFVMSGLSKVLALPQMKLAWTAVLGPEELRREALYRLEFIADTFLSVCAVPANAAAAWLQGRVMLQTAVKERIRANLTILDSGLSGQPLVRRLPVEGGWAVLLRFPATDPDVEFAQGLLDREGLLVHPGSFFGLPGGGWVVVSLLPQSSVFRAGMQAFFSEVERYSTDSYEPAQ